MRHKTKLIKFVIILMTFFFFSGCDSPDSDDDSGFAPPDSDDDNSVGAPFEIDDIWMKGSGCWYEDTYKVELNSNDEGDTITVEFSDYSDTTDDESSFGSAYCDIEIPIKVPAGMSVGLAGIDHEGAAYIPSGGEGGLYWDIVFDREWEPGEFPLKTYFANYDEYHEFSHQSTDPVLWSECGKDKVTACFDSDLFVMKSYNSPAEAQGHVSKIKLHLKWKECE